MTHVFHASLTVTLPDDPTGMAMTASRLIGGWAEMLEGLEMVTGEPDLKSEWGIKETATQPTTTPPAPRRGRGRPRKLQPVNGGPGPDALPPVPSAAA